MTRPRKNNRALFGISLDGLEQELFGAPLALSNQPQIVRDAQELNRLRELAKQERAWQIDLFLKKRARQVVNYWREQLGAQHGPGRPSKELWETESFRVACLVESLLPKYKDAFELRATLRRHKTEAIKLSFTERTRRLAKELDRAGYPGEIVVNSKSPRAAAVKEVADKCHLEEGNVARYHKHHQGLIASLRPLNLQR